MRLLDKPSELNSKGIPEIILIDDDDDTANLSPIESPLSLARKRYTAHLMNECITNVKGGPKLDFTLSRITRDEEKNTNRNKTLSEIDLKPDDNFSQYLHEHVLESNVLKKVRPLYIESWTNNEIRAKQKFNQRYYNRSESISTLTEEDNHEDLSGEIFALFEKQNKLKEKSKNQSLTNLEDMSLQSPNKELYSKGGERFENYSFVVDEDFDDDDLQGTKYPKIKSRVGRRREKSSKGRSSDNRFYIPQHRPKSSSPARPEYIRKKAKRNKGDRDQLCWATSNGSNEGKSRSKNSPKPYNSNKTKDLKYASITSNFQIKAGTLLALSKDTTNCGMCFADIENLIKNRIITTPVRMRKTFPEAA